ncbi:retinol dehydrogenase 14 [Paraphoma chrysanthemicola]|uniref:Retinol dehydrogenase 14 n=1 Tax=Paraphoma chrysanthemicola TaxID=798071 RepID=A0A8K0VUA0_9PLEO|nr:retinol dehydrogenase 14 [Paraphoma chrysanthemicola]
MSTSKFNPATDIVDQSGRVYFVTGGTAGLGASSIAFIASHNPAHIYFSGRNKDRAAELITKVQKTSPSTKFTFVQCDLSDLSSVQSASQEFLAQSDRLDVLMCNAGIMATPVSLSKDGYEIQFATNHLGHALLIKLLLPCMLKTAAEPNSDVRIVNLSSVAYKTTPNAGIEFSKLKTKDANYGPFYNPNKWMCYGQSKLANLLYPIELAARHPSITSVAVHPGFIKTELHAHEGFFDRQIVDMLADKWLDEKEGAYNQTWAATTLATNLQNGAYYEPVGVKTVPATKQGKDQALAEELWEWTEKELKAWI